MRGVDPTTLGTFRQSALQLADQLRAPAVRSGRVDATDRADVARLVSQATDINVLAEEILGRYRGIRRALEAAVQALSAAEGRIERDVLQPNRQVLEALSAAQAAVRGSR